MSAKGFVVSVPKEKRQSCPLGWFKNPVSSQTEKLMVGTKFSDYLGLKHYRNAKKIKHFNHLGLAQRPQSFSSYHNISPAGNSGHQLKKHVLVTLYNAILRIARNFLETRENIKISTHPFYHINLG